ncbi:hypothetical protein XENTR_v10022088 [Xenopus tropicalis]|nr:hypothetical protein XENTR_v10022088 [Xenopus tropicalis]
MFGSCLVFISTVFGASSTHNANNSALHDNLGLFHICLRLPTFLTHCKWYLKGSLSSSFFHGTHFRCIRKGFLIKQSILSHKFCHKVQKRCALEKDFSCGISGSIRSSGMLRLHL